MKHSMYGKYILYGILGLLIILSVAGDVQTSHRWWRRLTDEDYIAMKGNNLLWDITLTGIGRCCPVLGFLSTEQTGGYLLSFAFGDISGGSSEGSSEVEYYHDKYQYVIDSQLVWEEMQLAQAGESGVTSINPAETETAPEESEENEAQTGEVSQSAEGEDQEAVSCVASIANVYSGVTSRMQQTISRAGYNLDELLDLNTLVNSLYVVNSGTSVSEDALNPAELLSYDYDVPKDTEEPVILLYHTHSQEGYADSVPGEVSHTVVGMGNYLTELLTARGYSVLHHTGIYDLNEAGELDRDPAYSKAAPELQQLLEENSSIRLVIDLHRDGVNEGVHLVSEVNGKPTAQIMFFNGMCRSEEGDYADLVHPYREVNLGLSLQMMLTTDAYYPGVSRVIYLKSMRYNQHMCCSALIEVGAQTNTVEEARNAIEILADIIDRVIQTEND